MKRRTRVPKAPRTAITREDLLTERELLFVLHYAGNQREAAIKAGFSPDCADTRASEMMRKPRVMEALARKQESALAAIDKKQANIVRSLDKKRVDNDRIAETLDQILSSPRHGKRGWADHIAALKLAAQLRGLVGVKEDANHMETEVQGGAFLMFRSSWRDRQRGDDDGGDTIEGTISNSN